jgi:tetratricopeptide (TPR) repeat protein
MHPQQQQLEYARRHADRGEWDVVAKIATEALTRNTGCAWAWHYRGIAAYRRSDYDAARADLREAVRLVPDDAEVLDHLGAVTAAMGEWNHARECFEAALRRNPNSVDAAYNLAKVHRELKDDAAAAKLFRHACDLQPTFWEAHANLANALRDAGDWKAAETAYRQAIGLRPNVARTWNHLGVMYLRKRSFSQAQQAFEQALRIQPDHIEAQINLGSVCHATGDLDQAAQLYRSVATRHPTAALPELSAVRLPTDPDTENVNGKADAAFSSELPDSLPANQRLAAAQLALANGLRDQGRASEAVTCYHEVIRITPHRVAVWNALGSCLIGMRQFEEAVSCFEKALALCPGQAQAENNLAAVRIASGRLEEGRDLLASVVAKHPGYIEARSNLGAVLQDLGEFDDAARHLDAAIAMAGPKFTSTRADAQWNRALLRLRRGDHCAGWPEYDIRWDRIEFCRTQYRAPAESAIARPEYSSHPVAKRITAAPRWRGEPLAGRTVLAFAEQGLGDAIQFVRFVKQLRARGARVILETHRALVPLLSNSSMADQVIGHGDEVPPHDFQVALMSLPAMLGVTSDADIAMAEPYLQASAKLAQSWRARLDSPGRLRIGIHWQGNPNYHMDRVRSIPLRHFRPVLEVADAEFVSLQHGFGKDQITVENLPAPVAVFDGIDQAAGPFMDTAAILSTLDVVVTSDSALAHLAGALGVRTFMALPQVSDWRWELDKETTAWYPTMRLFRQRNRGDWQEVFVRIAAELRAFSG